MKDKINETIQTLSLYYTAQNLDKKSKEVVEKDILPNLVIYEQGEIVINSYSGESVFLEPKALALYDFIQGSHLLMDGNNLDTLISIYGKDELDKAIRKRNFALKYFKYNWFEEYIILLDYF